jgi:hypothetical protein
MPIKHSFALVEVLVSLVLLTLCASMIAPYFHDMYGCYRRTVDKIQGEYLVEEYLTDAYASYLKKPPPFEEVMKGMTSKVSAGDLTIVRTLETHLPKSDEVPTVCTADLTVKVHREAEGLPPSSVLATGSITLCFQKNTS